MPTLGAAFFLGQISTERRAEKGEDEHTAA